MFWTLYDPLVKRDEHGSCCPVHDVHLPRTEGQAASQTAETVLFLLEDTSKVSKDDQAFLFN